ncbi:hypothetical protein CRUP_035883 [Coryphaenoides rupestris]|nr:hypothetical protein CRUP_035883 [Coryphaenoides rupestris]
MIRTRDRNASASTRRPSSSLSDRCSAAPCLAIRSLHVLRSSSLLTSVFQRALDLAAVRLRRGLVVPGVIWKEEEEEGTQRCTKNSIQWIQMDSQQQPRGGRRRRRGTVSTHQHTMDQDTRATLTM